MHKLLITGILILLSTLTYGQDLIIKTNGSKIKCRISQVKNDTIYYEKKEGGMMLMQNLPLKYIREYRKDYFTSETKGTREIMVEEYPPYRFVLGGGMTYMIGGMANTLPDAMNDYLNALRPGYHIRALGSYAFSADYGIGLKYVFSHNNHKAKDLSVLINGQTYTGNFQDNIKIHFLGPTAVYRNITTIKGVTFLTNFTLGYLYYTNDAVSLSMPITLNGQALGLHSSSGFDFKLTENMGLGINVSYFMSWLSQYTVGSGSSKQTINLEGGNFENLSRIEVSAGLRFY